MHFRNCCAEMCKQDCWLLVWLFSDRVDPALCLSSFLDCTGLDREPVQKSYLLKPLSQLGIHSTWCFFIFTRSFFLGCCTRSQPNGYTSQCTISHLASYTLLQQAWTPGPVCCDGTLPLWFWCSQPILALPTGGQ